MRHDTRERRPFRPSDLIRTIKSVQATGLIVRRVEFDGMRLIVETSPPDAPAAKESDDVVDRTGWADYQ